MRQDLRPSAIVVEHPSARRSPPEAGLSKVPEITVWFWAIKILTTGMGETTSDTFVKLVDPVVAVAVAAVLLAAALVAQFRARGYVPAIYWLAVVMVSIFGTMAADVLHVVLGIPYFISTGFYAVVLAAIFAAWYATEGTLSIGSISTPRREAFYWATVLATFALGTAAGDLTAMTFGWGYLLSGVLFAIAFIVPAVAYARASREDVLTFWFAYVITRPLGASFADWMGKPATLGGLNWGDGPVSLGWAAVIVALVAVLAFTRVDKAAD